ncbi:cytochrome P450 [Oceanicella actignis]|uniref:Cytochrome P450 n=1 Tax=Oceanicella actignis TaxID=1189325 RepID=A0A1M7SHQ3_9RHOB|nr:cytochrome P450 [Oceanicella actignis]SET18965.1 Cytochrome P450 [Oceanicella actignis]SHN58011.1 Cytochrome P450 [Oceanicella actignis]
MPQLPLFEQSPRDPAFVQDPFPAYERMRALGPAVFWRDYGMAVFARHADVAALLRDRRLGRAPAPELAPQGPPADAFDAFERLSLLEREPPDHTRLRALVNRAFTSRAIAGFAPRIRAVAVGLADALPAEEADLMRAYAEPLPVRVIAELLGAPPEAAAQMRAWSHDMTAMYRFAPPPGARARANAAAQAFGAFMAEVIERRRRAPGRALIDALIAAEQDGARLSRDELIATSILLMNAGHEATTLAIGLALKLALTGTATPAALAAETGPDEALRLDPPMHLFTRHVREDLEHAGATLRRGQVIGLALGAANRDPERFARPELFDPRRPGLAGHVGLGAGIHFCVGAPLARLEMRAAVAALFARWPRIRLIEAPRFEDRYHFRALGALRVRPAG